ncbi:hypothetical protein K1X09_10725 [Paenibacillus lautus]|nr:hypothetical protein [Paenibacillus lautus]
MRAWDALLTGNALNTWQPLDARLTRNAGCSVGARKTWHAWRPLNALITLETWIAWLTRQSR